MTTATRQLVTDGDPDTSYPVPPEDWFFDGESGRWHEFIEDKNLADIGQALILQKLRHLDDGEFTVDFRWKRRGAVSKGNAMLGNCVPLSGAASHYSNGTHMLVFLAANHCEGFTRWQVEALVYHELLKVERIEKFKEDKETGKITQLPTVYRTLGPEFSGFYQEIREYGLWQSALAPLASVIQPLLPGFGEQV